MNNWTDGVMAFVVLTNLFLMGSSRLAACIRVVAAQGIALGFFSLLIHEGELTTRLALLALWSTGLKGVVFPWLLRRAIRETNARREVEPIVSYTTSLLIGTAALAISLWISSRLPLPVANATLSLSVSVAFFTIMTGFFIIISRSKAVTQVLGYLTLENGIYIIGVALVQKTPLLVEFAILLDVFVAVFVMGITIFHINREFDHIDTDRLSSLKD